jgi:hypothetical protein
MRAMIKKKTSESENKITFKGRICTTYQPWNGGVTDSIKWISLIMLHKVLREIQRLLSPFNINDSPFLVFFGTEDLEKKTMLCW